MDIKNKVGKTVPSSVNIDKIYISMHNWKFSKAEV
jgi:hypothetical protein